MEYIQKKKKLSLYQSKKGKQLFHLIHLQISVSSVASRELICNPKQSKTCGISVRSACGHTRFVSIMFWLVNLVTPLRKRRISHAHSDIVQ